MIEEIEGARAKKVIVEFVDGSVIEFTKTYVLHVWQEPETVEKPEELGERELGDETNRIGGYIRIISDIEAPLNAVLQIAASNINTGQELGQLVQKTMMTHAIQAQRTQKDDLRGSYESSTN